MRKEFHLNDTQIGLLGTAFIWIYAIVGVPLGRIADSASRKKAGAPKSLFPITLTEAKHSFAVANDGQRFLIGTSAGGEKALPMTVVLNWQAGLKK